MTTLNTLVSAAEAFLAEDRSQSSGGAAAEALTRLTRLTTLTTLIRLTSRLTAAPLAAENLSVPRG